MRSYGLPPPWCPSASEQLWSAPRARPLFSADSGGNSWRLWYDLRGVDYSWLALGLAVTGSERLFLTGSSSTFLNPSQGDGCLLGIGSYEPAGEVKMERFLKAVRPRVLIYFIRNLKRSSHSCLARAASECSLPSAWSSGPRLNQHPGVPVALPLLSSSLSPQYEQNER